MFEGERVVDDERMEVVRRELWSRGSGGVARRDGFVADVFEPDGRTTERVVVDDEQ